MNQQKKKKKKRKKRKEKKKRKRERKIKKNTIKKKKRTRKKIFSTQISFSNFKEGNFEEEKSPQTKKLLLTGELFFNKELIITHYGLINSRRKKNDNQTFFGITEGNDYTGTPYNDFIINLQNENNEEKIPNNGRIFGISHSKKTHDYQLYILNGNYYIYYEIRDSLYFFNNKDYLFLLGRTFLTITQKDINKVKSLEIKMESEDDNNIDPNKILNFNINDCPITIGRINSKININSTCISKQHAVIEFNEEEGKFLFKDLQSTNGSILIMKDDDVIKLNGFMKFKLNDILFNILELP